MNENKQARQLAIDNIGKLGDCRISAIDKYMKYDYAKIASDRSELNVSIKYHPRFAHMWMHELGM
jgi:hypothetical protein